MRWATGAKAQLNQEQRMMAGCWLNKDSEAIFDTIGLASKVLPVALGEVFVHAQVLLHLENHPTDRCASCYIARSIFHLCMQRQLIDIRCIERWHTSKSFEHLCGLFQIESRFILTESSVLLTDS